VTRPADSADIAQVAAVVAVVVALDQRRAAEAAPEQLSMWVQASRRAAQRAGLQRGPWRLSGRLPRRSRT
jgi:antitoxin (DNA-binding transcriptional repressor) of toxin-antitoxin stability system